MLTLDGATSKKEVGKKSKNKKMKKTSSVHRSYSSNAIAKQKGQKKTDVHCFTEVDNEAANTGTFMDERQSIQLRKRNE